jgi:hypothetical protein
VLKAAISEKKPPATPPLAASPEKPNPEAERRDAIVNCLNALVDAPLANNPRSISIPWSFFGPREHLFQKMTESWTSPGLPGDPDSLVRWLQANYKLLRAAGLAVTFPKHPQNGPDQVRVERLTDPEAYHPAGVDGVHR